MATVESLTREAEQLVLPPLGEVDDAELMALQRRLGTARRRVDTASAEVAAEIARRSSRDRGYGGLAQRIGARTPERLVQRLTGSSLREARALVDTGRLLATESTVGDPGETPAPRPEPLVAAALRAGVLTVEQSRAIEIGLGPTSERIADADLEPARAELIALADSVPVEELRAHARVLRDELDTDGVEARADELRARRFLRLIRQDDGMTRLIGLLDPESAARVQAIVDATLSPRRAGPRFTHPDDVARADRLTGDPRTDDQVSLDTVIALLDSAAAADTASRGAVLGRGGAPVHVLVTGSDLRAGSGVARIVGQDSAVSVATAERRICTDGALPVVFDSTGTNVLRLGREVRRFTARQRAALIARDGGCRMCGRPPSQCEAHHRIPWSHGGNTDLDNAILLCRFHHLLVHDNGWRIEEDPVGDIWFVPPPDVDPLQRFIPAHPPNPVVRRLTA